MSDFYSGPSAQSIDALGKAVSGGLDMVGQKLYNAEAMGQYLSAYSAMQKNFANFDSQIQMDPNWQQYGTKVQQNDSKFLEQVLPTVKNSAARAKFIEDFTQSRAQHYAAITRLATQRRIADLYGNGMNQLQDSLTAVKRGGYSKSARQTFDTTIKGVLGIAGQLSGYEQYRLQEVAKSTQRAMAMDYLNGGAMNTAIKVLQQGGTEQDAINAGMRYAITSGNSPRLDLSPDPNADRRTVANLVKTQLTDLFGKQTAQYEIQDEQTFQKILDDALQGNIMSDAELGSLQQAGKLFVGDPKTQNSLLTSLQTKLEELRRQRNPSTASIPSTSEAYIAATNVVSQDIPEAQKVIKIAQIPGLNKSDTNMFRKAAAANTDASYRQVVADFSKMTGSTETAPGTGKPWTNEDHQRALEMLNQFKASPAYQNASPSDIVAEGNKIKSVIDDQVLKTAVKDSFRGNATANFFGGPWSTEAEMSDFLQRAQKGEFNGLWGTTEIQNDAQKFYASLIPYVQNATRKQMDPASAQITQNGTVMLKATDGTTYEVIPSPQGYGKLDIRKVAP